MNQPKYLKGLNDPGTNTFDRETRYEVAGILDEKLRYNKSYLLIRWVGYSELFDNSWEPLEEIESGAPKVLKRWRKDHAPLK